jgi:hypothetical protein
MQNRRSNDRRLPECELFVYDESIDHPLGLVEDMTASGCKLKSTCPIKIAKIFQCKLIFPELVLGITEVSFLAQVKWCHESETPDEFELGLEFQDLTSRERMMLSLLIVPWESSETQAQRQIETPPAQQQMIFSEKNPCS